MQIIGLIGNHGAGRTTLAYALLGEVVKPTPSVLGDVYVGTGGTRQVVKITMPDPKDARGWALILNSCDVVLLVGTVISIAISDELIQLLQDGAKIVPRFVMLGVVANKYDDLEDIDTRKAWESIPKVPGLNYYLVSAQLMLRGNLRTGADIPDEYSDTWGRINRKAIAYPKEAEMRGDYNNLLGSIFSWNMQPYTSDLKKLWNQFVAYNKLLDSDDAALVNSAENIKKTCDRLLSTGDEDSKNLLAEKILAIFKQVIPNHRTELGTTDPYLKQYACSYQGNAVYIQGRFIWRSWYSWDKVPDGSSWSKYWELFMVLAPLHKNIYEYAKQHLVWFDIMLVNIRMGICDTKWLTDDAYFGKKNKYGLYACTEDKVNKNEPEATKIIKKIEAYVKKRFREFIETKTDLGYLTAYILDMRRTEFWLRANNITPSPSVRALMYAFQEWVKNCKPEYAENMFQILVDYQDINTLGVDMLNLPSVSRLYK